MRWGSLLIVSLAASQAHAKPKVVAIARAALPKPKVDAKQFTNDPVLAGADRVVGKDRPGYVAFTFDDGPNINHTPAVLAALQEYDVPATFFIVTRHITSSKDVAGAKKLLAQELELGFTIGDHTAHHANLQQSDSKLDKEIDNSIVTLSTEVKQPIGLFRAPYGRLNQKSRDRLHELGVTDVYWSIDSRDWELDDPAELRTNLLAAIKRDNGGVILMHDTKEITAAAIHDVLDDLERENCRRLAKSEPPIWPVSIHYFLSDNGAPRAIPDDVKKRTEAYQQGLPDRCAKRAARNSRKPANK